MYGRRGNASSFDVPVRSFCKQQKHTRGQKDDLGGVKKATPKKNTGLLEE